MEQVTIALPHHFELRKVGIHMPKSRHQRGYVSEVGKGTKKWAGHYHVYILDENGREQRRKKYVILGLKSQMRKWEAEDKLFTLIAKETGTGTPRPDPEVTFGWFWKFRYLPLKESRWKRSQRDAVSFVMDKHVLPKFRDIRLCDVNKFDIQTHLNELSKNYSESLVDKAFTYINASLEEAVDQEFIPKNPARKVEMPQTRRPCKRNHSPEEVRKLMSEMSFKDSLIFQLFVVAALRPGELFALRWGDIEPGQIKIDEAVYRNQLQDPKTESSRAHVSIPPTLEIELARWKESCKHADPEDFVFEARYRGKPMDGRSYLRRYLKPLARKHGIEGLTFQSLRRTFATQVHQLGTVKDAQTQLRHAHASTTLDIYTQVIPESVRQTVAALHQRLFGINTDQNSRVN